MTKTYSVLDGDPAEIEVVTKALRASLSGNPLEKNAQLAKDEHNAKNIVGRGLGLQYCNNGFQQIVWASHRIAFLENALKAAVGDDMYAANFSRNRGDK